MIRVISNNRRAIIKQAVYEILSRDDQPCLPVKIGKLIRSFKNIKLITYSSQIRKYNISYNELVINAETKDSYAVYCKSKDSYCIYYNDLDKNIVNSNRVRWNLAHELGHVALKHHDICNRNKLFRNNIDDKTYKYLEEEADYFAQLILVPHAALVGFKVNNYKTISSICKISNPAAKKRLYEYSRWMKDINSHDAYDKQIFELFYSFIFKKACQNCGAGVVQQYGKFCPICGKKTLMRGDGNMNYDKLITYRNGKLKKCPTCKNEETDIEGYYCQICCERLKNKCLDDNACNCSIDLPSNARFCPVCGSRSLFNLRGILKKWNYYEDKIDNIDEELPFS